MIIVCTILTHRRRRHKVWDDGLNYRSTCRWCGRSMLKDEHSGWRVFDSETDFDVKRRGKPTR